MSGIRFFRPKPKLLDIPIQCAWCGKGPIDRSTRTCPDCGTTMPGSVDPGQKRLKFGRHIIPGHDSILNLEVRYHGPGRRLTDGLD